MGRVSNETTLVVALLKEKAEAQKRFSNRNAMTKDMITEDLYYRKGIDWVLETLDGIVKEVSNH